MEIDRGFREESVFFFFFKDNEQPRIRRLSDFTQIIQELAPHKVGSVVYRGHADVTWKTETSLFRNKKLYSSENAIFRTLLASQPESFQSDTTMLDRLVRMQHFSLPTRLLDVTWNPLVALYFCVNSHEKSDGHVLTIGFKASDNKFFDSDTISCISNLVYMSPRERNVLRDKASLSIGDFNDLEESKRLLHFIKAEKPYFLPIINPKDLKRRLLVRPKQNNKRIIAQNGAFVLFGLSHKPLEKHSNYSIQKLVIKAVDKPSLAKELDVFGFNDQSMFPELETASKYIARKFG
ncbi:FRG domain-containing protein [Acidocella aquatica]|uniref:FRG domain-containing protein n=1 Tax=Acidocella aquatica TaxID=1922313 RepID=UPI0024E16B54|nr:FRG domain-containing protein [Acidocella aquatica]